jgi:hypothetical protein
MFRLCDSFSSTELVSKYNLTEDVRKIFTFKLYVITFLRTSFVLSVNGMRERLMKSEMALRAGLKGKKESRRFFSKSQRLKNRSRIPLLSWESFELIYFGTCN